MLTLKNLINFNIEDFTTVMNPRKLKVLNIKQTKSA